MFVFIVILIIVLLFVSYKCFKFAVLLIDIQDSVQNAIDVLDAKHQSIHNILQRPLFYDSQEIRQVVKDIEEAKNSIHNIALKLTKDFSVDSDE